MSSAIASIATSLERVIDHRVRFRVMSVSSNTTRSYRSFSDAVGAVIDACVYAAIDIRKADEDGAEIGEDVACDALGRSFEPA